MSGRSKTRVKLKLDTHVENIVVIFDIIIDSNSIVYVELDEIVLQIHICQTVVRWLDKNVEHDSLDPQERKEILCLMLSRHELR